MFNISPFEFVMHFNNSLYFPNWNTFIIGTIGGINVLKIYYGFIFITIPVAHLSFLIFMHLWQSEQTIPFSQTVSLTAIIALLLFSGAQQIQRLNHMNKEKNIFSGKTKHEKNVILFGKKYQFTQECLKALEGRHQGALLSDLDLQKDPHMFVERLLAYHLYPKVSLRFKNGSPDDILLLFGKKNPLTQIPEDYDIILSSENHHYILAIKKHASK